MDLFELAGKITVDASDAKKALDDVSQKGGETESKLSKFFSGMGKVAATAGKAIATGLAVGGAAMGALTVKALNLSGELEQNMGGSEQVFKEHATSMQNIAKDAFSNMGLSTSDFLATANKMGALFQGAGFDIETSATMSADAMQRAADVASIMGIDTSAAMEAIAGAAKGNFTMMDNLGVAMNDTTLQAYALEKGINKSTQEMTNQEKIGLAMEMFMEKTAYAADNYARENATLAGSLGTAKAALTNFLDGSGDVDSLVTSFSNAATVIVNSLSEIAPRLTTGLVDIVSSIVPLIPPLLQQLLPVIINGAVSLVDGLIAAIPMVISAIMDCLPDLIAGVTKLVGALAKALPTIFQSIVKALPAAIGQILEGIVQTAPLLIESVVSLITTLAEALPEFIALLVTYLPILLEGLIASLLEQIPILIESLVMMITMLIEQLPVILPVLIDMLITIVMMLVEQLPVIIPMLIDACIAIVMAIIEALPDILIALTDALPQILQAVWDAIVMVFTGLPEWFGQIFQGAWDAICGIFSGLGEWFASIWQAVVDLFTPVGEWFSSIFSDAWEGIKSAWSTVTEWFSGIWDSICEAFSAVGTWFSDMFTDAWEDIKLAFSSVKTFFSGIWTDIKGAFSAVGTWFQEKFSDAWQKVKDVFSGVKTFFTGIWDKIKTTFSGLGTKISDAISGAVKSGINGLIGSAESIINGFLKMINNCISTINEIPGVEISKVKLVSFTRLAEGTVVDKPTPAIFGEDGAEAVVPLEKHTGWLTKIAKQLHEFIISDKDGFTTSLSMRSMELQQAQVSEMQMLNGKVDRIIELLVQFFPDMIEALNISMYLDTGALVAETAPAMDIELGMISTKKGRGR